MAYERLSDKKSIAINLGTFITSQINLLVKLRTRQNLDDEARFTQAVLEDNLTLEQQLKYRNDQMKRVKETRDDDEIRRVRNAISALKDTIEQDEFNNKYIDEIDKLNAGTQSIENTMNWLQKRLDKTTDLNIIKSIRNNISQLKTRRYTQQQTALSKQTEYAAESKMEDIIDKQITKVNDTRYKAVLAGNDDYIALLDLQLQSLNKSLNESRITKAMTDFSVATMTGGSSLALLNQFNSQIESADVDTPINIGGVRYDSPQQFWELKRGEYLNDRTGNGFFGRYSTELQNKIDYRSNAGILTNNNFSDVKNWYNTVKDRPELEAYQDHVSQHEQNSLKSMADLRAQSILNDFAIKLDAKKAVSELAWIQDTHGIDQTLNYQKVVTSAAQEKQTQVSQILDTMQDIMKASPGISNQEALNQAVASGAGAIFAPEELATTPAEELITKAGEKAEAEEFKAEKPPVTISPTEEGAPFAPKTEYKEGGLYKIPNEILTYKYEGGKLRPLTGKWDE